MEDSKEWVEQAMNGDQQALEKLIMSVKDKIYNLSLRMLWNPMDAEDVTQEILIKVVTKLSTFRMDSKFSTWVYRIASNHLITMKKRGLEHQELSFDIFERGIHIERASKDHGLISEVDRELLAEELKVSCTHAMLLCLDREHRMIYILSSMFGVTSNEGALIMNITPEAYRKRLSRTREKMRSFMENNCGLVNQSQVCRCNQRVEVAIEYKRINPEQLLFVQRPLADHDLVGACKEEMEEFDNLSAVFASNPYYLAPEHIFTSIRDMMTLGKYKILDH